MPSLHDILEESILLTSDSGADALIALTLDEKPELALYIGDGQGDYAKEDTQALNADDLDAILEQAETWLDERLEADEG